MKQRSQPMHRFGTLITLVVTVFGLSACATPSSVDVYLTNITPMPSTLFEQRARLELRIQNLGDEPIEATGVEVDLRLNGRRLARGVDGQNFAVPRLGDATTSVVVSSSVFGTITQLLRARDRSVFTYGLKGKLFTSGRGRAFSRTGELSRADLQPLVPGVAVPAN